MGFMVGMGFFLRVILCYILVAVLIDFNNTKEKKINCGPPVPSGSNISRGTTMCLNNLTQILMKKKIRLYTIFMFGKPL